MFAVAFAVALALAPVVAFAVTLAASGARTVAVGADQGTTRGAAHRRQALAALWCRRRTMRQRGA